MDGSGGVDCSETSRWPRLLPVEAAPSRRDSAYAQAVLRCLVAWMALPCAEGVTLAMLAETSAFHPLLNALGVGGETERLRIAELLAIALEGEPVDLDDAEEERYCHLPEELQAELMGVGARALAPMAAAAQAAAAQPAEAEHAEHADEAMLALLGFSARLLYGGAALLRGGSSGGGSSGGGSPLPEALALLRTLVSLISHPDRAVAETLGAADPWGPVLRASARWPAAPRAELQRAMLEALSSRARLPSDETVRALDREEINEMLAFRRVRVLTTTHFAPSVTPPPLFPRIHHAHHRPPPPQIHLGPTLSTLASPEPLALSAHCASLLHGRTSDTPAAAGVHGWQQRELALFTLAACAEPLQAAVAYADEANELESSRASDQPSASQQASTLLQSLTGSLLSSSALEHWLSPTCAPSAHALPILRAARCELLGALAGWLARDAALLPDALTALFSALEEAPHAGASPPHGVRAVGWGEEEPPHDALGAEPAVAAFVQLSYHARHALGGSERCLRLLFGRLAPLPTLPPPLLGRFLEASVRIVCEAPPPPPLDAFFSPLLGALDEAMVAALAHAETCSTHAQRVSPSIETAVAKLAMLLELCAHTVRPLRSLSGAPAALVSLLCAQWSQALILGGRLHPSPLSERLLAATDTLAAATLRSAAPGAVEPLLPEVIRGIVHCFEASGSSEMFTLASALFKGYGETPGVAEHLLVGLCDAALVLYRRSGTSAAPDGAAPDGAAPDGAVPDGFHCALFSYLDAHTRRAPSVLCRVLELPSFVSHAAAIVGSCRQPKAAAAAVSFLDGLSRASRLSEEEHVRATFQAALAGEQGAALIRGCIIGLSDSLPMPSVPRIADVLGALLASPGWTAQTVRAWATQALREVPERNGSPDEATKRTILEALVRCPDLCAGGQIDQEMLEVLRDATSDFARVCRGLKSADDFYVAAYDEVALE